MTPLFPCSSLIIFIPLQCISRKCKRVLLPQLQIRTHHNRTWESTVCKDRLLGCLSECLHVMAVLLQNLLSSVTIRYIVCNFIGIWYFNFYFPKFASDVVIENYRPPELDFNSYLSFHSKFIFLQWQSKTKVALTVSDSNLCLV
ncbi:hypothetical protein EPI10_029340 [Gossypium australe]|uniref:Uncharacterized protein n=1 Tax=Gossypium australe TaxID=47621 RepID=A0A5B6V177_9ROSI|nr:hypothetical protein EPI10_029340 [Gossypium australe]